MLILQACNTRDFTVRAYLRKFTVSNLKTPHPEWLENPGITLACLTSGPSFGTERMNSSIKRLLFLGVAQIITSLCLIIVPFVKNYFALLTSKFLIYLLHLIKIFMICFLLRLFFSRILFGSFDKNKWSWHFLAYFHSQTNIRFEKTKRSTILGEKKRDWWKQDSWNHLQIILHLKKAFIKFLYY